jgi:hypothetical protein
MTQPDIFDDSAPWAEWLPELRHLLSAYNSVSAHEEAFVDTDETPSKAMRSYLRMATYYPGRAFRATAEILDVLRYGLDEADVVSNLDSMPTIFPPPGRTREQCLEAMIPHLVAFTENGEQTEPAVPVSRWEWTEWLPNLADFFGGSFHQDADAVHPGVEDLYQAVEDAYLRDAKPYEVAAAAREIRELQALDLEEPALADAVAKLGSDWPPGKGRTFHQWLDHLAERFTAHLDATGYQPPPGRDPAYPAHDLRSQRT